MKLKGLHQEWPLSKKYYETVVSFVKQSGRKLQKNFKLQKKTVHHKPIYHMLYVLGQLQDQREWFIFL